MNNEFNILEILLFVSLTVGGFLLVHLTEWRWQRGRGYYLIVQYKDRTGHKERLFFTGDGIPYVDSGAHDHYMTLEKLSKDPRYTIFPMNFKLELMLEHGDKYHEHV